VTQDPVAPSHIGSALTFAVLALTILVIVRSPRKWHTILYIIGSMIIGGLLGTALGRAFQWLSVNW
jgi:hypothetical protein